MRTTPSIIQFPDKMLSTPTKKVTRFDSKLRDLVNTMSIAMHSNGGVGITANQIGISASVVIVFDPEARKSYIFCNPEILKAEGVQNVREGCLSKEGIFINKERPLRLVGRYRDLNGKPQTIRLEGLLCQIFTHELEHTKALSFLDNNEPDYLWIK